MLQVSNARTELIAGIRAITPMLMGIAPFGMVCGAAAVSTGFTPWQAFAMGWIIFAGSAQIAAMQLFASGAPMLIIISTAAVINLRFMMYSASIAPHFRQLNGRWHLLLAYLVTDQAYAQSIAHLIENKESKDLHWYFLGIGSALWVCWQISTVIGIVLGSLTPQSWSLDFIIPLTFIAMVVPLLSSRAMLLAAVAGGSASVLLALPLKLNLIAAALVGIGAGLLVETLGRAK